MKVVISNFSILSSIGCDKNSFEKNLFAGASGISDIRSLPEWKDSPIPYAALLPANFYPPINANQIGQEDKCAIDHLMEDLLSGEKRELIFDLIIIAGNEGMPQFPEILQFTQNPDTVNWSRLNPEFKLQCLMAHLKPLGQKDLDKSQVVYSVNGCITSLAAIGIAFKRISAGISSRALILNLENRVRLEELLRYNTIGALAKEPFPAASSSRPFSLSRNGFVKGEGGGVMIVESGNSAEVRGAQPLAEISGFSQSADAWRLTEGREDCLGMIESMETLFDHFKFDRNKVDYINAHGTGTAKNDFLETQAIKKVFGMKASLVPMSSLKSQIGHLNYACGMVETAACLLMFKNQTVSPTISHDPDPELDLDYVPNTSRKMKLNYILKNSFGFGGANASLLLGRI